MSRLEVKVGAVSSERWLRVCGFGASGLQGWRFAIVDIYTGKGVVGVGNYILFLFFLRTNYPCGLEKGC